MASQDDIDNFLSHSGVLGMHWGHHKPKDPTGSAKGSSHDFSKAVPANKKLSNKEQINNLSDNENKSRAKVGLPPHKLTQKQKEFIFGGALIAGSVAYLAGATILEKKANAKSAIALAKYIKTPLGKYSITADKAQALSWAGKNSYFHPSAFARKAYTIPVGNVFHRLSTATESSFKPTTYTTHSIEDFHRYVSKFRHEKFSSVFYHVTFKAEKEIRVPDLNTTLTALQHTMDSQLSKVHTDIEVLTKYGQLSGGYWEDSISTGLFAKLKDQGYHAIVDEMDAGVVGHTPLVLFDAASMSSKVSSILSPANIKEAETLVKELPIPKI